MLTEMEKAEYLEEIRQQVCSRCIERPPGGPPCEPLGKQCGVEMHLPELIESIHQVNSRAIAPYLDHNREQICETCAFLHSSICPCPMDYLVSLIVEAVETVDQRNQYEKDLRLERILKKGRAGTPESIHEAFETGQGNWTGCDWPTRFGNSVLDLNGWTSDMAKGMAQQETDQQRKADWQVAAEWLVKIEDRARKAEARAASAIKAVDAGHWQEALQFAESAWALEFSTGRPLRHGHPLAWLRLREEIEAGCFAQDLWEMEFETCLRI